MGRRAKKAPVVTKKRPVLAKKFKCPFCASENAVECIMNLKGGIGKLTCRLCAASFQMPIHHLHEPIDVFSEWIDACEAAERTQGNAESDFTGQSRITGQLRTRGLHDEDEDDDDDDDLLGEASGFTTTKSNSSINHDKQEKVSNPSQTRSRPSYATLGLDDSDDDE